ncbi:type II toxin-antitoxin system RelE/ParE family toxin [Dyadobacter sp. 3J3]|uniref:type II toxin-antitoxin system RelE/ParE family toxin n=1 Tax=Dyadobacter sp. 3J3 TaxID=2606600 RepID=UPI00135C2D11|nr:type II toxin-antitoxin system RelE/ParE family toxin [Dyadobacter sp. 3J3]
MRYEIILTQTAIETYEAIFEQIQTGWGDKVAGKFEVKMFEVLHQISQTPLIFKSIVEKATVRKGLINKNCSFFYEVNGNEILILFFWDNRQDPLFT